MDVDFSELDRLAADLGEVAHGSAKPLEKAVAVTARKVRNTWRDQAKGMPHAPAFPFSISYDIKKFGGFGADVISAEIGPDKGRAQGALGNLIEFGSRNNPPQGLGHGALQANEEDFVNGLEKARDDMLKAGGL